MHKLTPEEMNRLDIEIFKHSAKTPIVLVLDNVRSLHNVGSALRTADAFRLQAVYMCGISGTPPSAEIHKTALGAEDSVSWRYFHTALEAVQSLHDEGYKVFAAEQVAGSIPLQSFCSGELLPPLALIFGNEVHGVSQDALDASDGAIEIPQYGTKHSLNVSVSIGIVLWEIIRHMQPK